MPYRSELKVKWLICMKMNYLNCNLSFHEIKPFSDINYVFDVNLCILNLDMEPIHIYHMASLFFSG